MELILASQDDTINLGLALGKISRAGEIILLIGELGAGKTLLCRGLARGLGVSDDYAITSPTFTLLNLYPGRLDFFHADLYRLEQGDARELDLIEEAMEGVLAVEWAERAGEFWPWDSIRVDLFIRPDESRRVNITGPQNKIAAIEKVLASQA
jgi:tRNA threonylcarbamoyladenosine biosynthesis protein TsaE